jgi:hypothetical protein
MIGVHRFTGCCGYGQMENTEPDLVMLESRMMDATVAAQDAAEQARVQAALAQQAQDFNSQIIVGFIAAGAFSVVMWGISQAVLGGRK